MAPCKNRWDAWGHKILSHADMLLYYKDDKTSLDIVRRFMPHRYVVLPTFELRISTQDCRSATVYEIYPGETKSREIELTERQLSGLRKTWKGKPGWKCSKVGNAYLVIRREGRVFLDPSRKYSLVK